MMFGRTLKALDDLIAMPVELVRDTAEAGTEYGRRFITGDWAGEDDMRKRP